MEGQEQEFAVEQVGTVERRTIKAKLVEGMDSIELDGDESAVMHLLGEFQRRQDMLAERQLGNMERLTQMRESLRGGPRVGLIDNSTH